MKERRESLRMAINEREREREGFFQPRSNRVFTYVIEGQEKLNETTTKLSRISANLVEKDPNSLSFLLSAIVSKRGHDPRPSSVANGIPRATPSPVAFIILTELHNRRNFGRERFGTFHQGIHRILLVSNSREFRKEDREFYRVLKSNR